MFASEDRLGTWRHLLVAVRSPRRIFVSKALSSLTVIVVLVIGLVCSSTISGLVVVGNRSLNGLDGHLLSPGDAAGRVLLAWACALAPTLALAAIGLLGSVALGRSPMGLLLPAVVALAMQIVQQLPVPVAIRYALPGYAFISWNGLFTSPAQRGPLLIGIAVSLVWVVVATALAYFLFVRRDFTNPVHDGSGRLAITAGLLPLVVLFGLTAGVLAPVAGVGSGIDQDKVQRSVAHGSAAPGSGRAGDADRPATAGPGRLPPRPSRLRLHQLERPLHQPGPTRAAADRSRGQPGLGDRRAA